MKILIFDADRCMEISRAIIGKSSDKLVPVDLLFFLPHDIFGQTLEATIKDGNFVISYNNETWFVPPFFVHSMCY